MRVRTLGVGGAFTDRFYHTNYVVEFPGCRLLVDAGTTLRYSLPASGFTVKDINAVALTHFHSDHVGGLEEFSQRCRYLYQYKPTVYAMPDQIPLLAGLFALHGTQPEDYLHVTAVTHSTVIGSTPKENYLLEYYSTQGLHAEVTSNYIIGIRRVDRHNKAVRMIFTGDIGPIEKSVLGRLMADPETIAVFHDCHTGTTATPAHPSLQQITSFYPPELYGKIHLTHYGDNIADYQHKIYELGFNIAVQGEIYKW
ncbi:MBL fold metallo-hydrolase [Sporomusa acidovorans]|uniref:Ribonuclease BN n=1 Tax=Sporomusa acidovorans (strain ATCC 49682 / DSM 3132 / Mol) TaxID=1123286 RepID=A0ABZ3IZN6_SPOA4|nr:MBL fold metallo-hydrolase [Sporomusa acidovorans]OZC18290.1 ribonuclease BN [Sporomusa acidovorans DSM 3132]SDF20895.1 Ribonuclease BN, tRNA processing enzyme [Sporomusa acidovorans]